VIRRPVGTVHMTFMPSIAVRAGTIDTLVPESRRRDMNVRGPVPVYQSLRVDVRSPAADDLGVG